MGLAVVWLLAVTGARFMAQLSGKFISPLSIHTPSSFQNQTLKASAGFHPNFCVFLHSGSGSDDLLELNLQLLLTFESPAQYSIVMPMALSKLIYFERCHCGATALTALKEAAIHQTLMGTTFESKGQGVASPCLINLNILGNIGKSGRQN